MLRSPLPFLLLFSCFYCHTAHTSSTPAAAAGHLGERNSPFLTEKASLALPTRILGSSKCFQVNKHSLIARK